MSSVKSDGQRYLGLFGAIGVGVGAIVGGGILALTGAAFAATGPSAVVAFALNGVIAFLTVLSFSEMSAAFPESGGTYVFSKKVLSIKAAFGVGWVIWFASIVAAVLYALGAGFFIAKAVKNIWFLLSGADVLWITSGFVVTVIALAATLIYTVSLVFKQSSGGAWVNIGKVAVFAILLIGGVWYLSKQPVEEFETTFTPFFAYGGLGLLSAMGYSFIALQGFDLISAVAGEIKEPAKVVPRAMMISLMIALAIYLPFLIIIAVTGSIEGESIAEASARLPEAIVIFAAENYLGRFGFWLVIAAGVLSMLSALYVNLLAASRIAHSMARDRTLPHRLGELNEERGTPVNAVIVTAIIVVVLVIVIPDVSAAGAAASLIFLVSFALAHLISILLRKRSVKKLPFKSPLFPLVPIVGIVTCVGLAVFQGVVVPIAGVIALLWLIGGGVLYFILFSTRAQVVDASAEGYDPDLVRLRGRSPLVLVPIANPSNARAMVAVASALAPPFTGRVLLLSVVKSPGETSEGVDRSEIINAESVLNEALAASFEIDLVPEALTTIGKDPWSEIVRVSATHGCESLLLGLTDLEQDAGGEHIEYVMNRVDCDVVVQNTPTGWTMQEAKRVLVPVGGRGGQGELLARLLGSICRTGNPEITFLRIVPEATGSYELERVRASLKLFAGDQLPYGRYNIKLEKSDDVAEVIKEHALESDLVILGLRRLGKRRKSIGDLALRLARELDCPLLMISRKG